VLIHWPRPFQAPPGVCGAALAVRRAGGGSGWQPCAAQLARATAGNPTDGANSFALAQRTTTSSTYRPCELSGVATRVQERQEGTRRCRGSAHGVANAGRDGGKVDRAFARTSYAVGTTRDIPNGLWARGRRDLWVTDA
jgi:hypothetical protein